MGGLDCDSYLLIHRHQIDVQWFAQSCLSGAPYTAGAWGPYCWFKTFWDQVGPVKYQLSWWNVKEYRYMSTFFCHYMLLILFPFILLYFILHSIYLTTMIIGYFTVLSPHIETSDAHYGYVTVFK